jgi:hypothetical protein
MAETQLSFFDAGLFDTEAAREYKRQQSDAELNALLIRYVGEKEARKWHEETKRRKAKFDAFMEGYQPSPEMQAAADRIFARVRASTKPLANDYALLGIEPGATKRDIKNAYRRMARKLHPDTGGNEEAFKQLHLAYRKLLKLVKE